MDIATATVLAIAAAAGSLLAVDILAAAPRLVAGLSRPPTRVVGGLVVAVTALAALGRTPARAATPPPMLRVERPLEPAAAPPLAAAGSTAAVTLTGARYQVVPGDTLWGIAARTLRDRDGATPDGAEVGRFWRRIYDENRALIGNDPDLIFPGQLLALPEA